MDTSWRLRKNDVANTCVENEYKKDAAHRETISRCGDIVSCGRKRKERREWKVVASVSFFCVTVKEEELCVTFQWNNIVPNSSKKKRLICFQNIFVSFIYFHSHELWIKKFLRRQVMKNFVVVRENKNLNFFRRLKTWRKYFWFLIDF